MSAPRRPRRQVHGLLVADKPLGPSSTQVLGLIKHLFGAEKAGHAGTLDPMASGLLPVLFGEATKFAQEGLEADKAYLAMLHLGITTETGDREGRVQEQHPVDVLPEAITTVLRSLLGQQAQVPPMCSALKHQGRPLYELARRGEVVERAARFIQIHEITLVSFESPMLEVQIRCSKGTYIRTLAEEIGKRLGCGAHLAGLRRNGVGPLDLCHAVAIESLEQAAEEGPHALDALLLPIDHLLQSWQAVTLSDLEASLFLNGQTLTSSIFSADLPRRTRVITQSKRFLGTALLGQGRLKPVRLVAQPTHH